MDIIRQTLNRMADHTPIVTFHSVSGGDINQSYYVQTKARPYFIKTNVNIPPHFFQAEATGLAKIHASKTIRVPEVYHFDRPAHGEQASIAMEWVEPGQKHSAEQLGYQIAQMHSQTSEKYGFGEPTFVGELHQPNEWCPTWLEYYRNFRLTHQIKIGITQGRVKGNRRAKLEELIERLEEWIPSYPQASLLHGDLWGGNWMTHTNGLPFLIDPSILYGDHSFELAFTELFGGFPQTFYDAYEDAFPLSEHYQDVKPLYQLFYLLVHLNIFGESYGASVDQILKRYIG